MLVRNCTASTYLLSSRESECVLPVLYDTAMYNCPVCVFHATNLPAGSLTGDCWNCGNPLGFHPARESSMCKPGTAYAVNPDAVTKKDLLTGESWTLRDEMDG